MKGHGRRRISGRLGDVPKMKYHYSCSFFTNSVERSEAATLPSLTKVSAVCAAGLVGSSVQRQPETAWVNTVRSEDTVGRGV